MLSSPLSTSSERVLSLLYVVAGSVVLSVNMEKLAMHGDVDHESITHLFVKHRQLVRRLA
jgi:hypothetical protein